MEYVYIGDMRDMIKKRSKIQVLISTYNGERYLEELIKSVLNQDIKQLAIIIRDDGSNDNTLKILSIYSNRDILKYLLKKILVLSKVFLSFLNYHLQIQIILLFVIRMIYGLEINCQEQLIVLTNFRKKSL